MGGLKNGCFEGSVSGGGVLSFFLRVCFYILMYVCAFWGGEKSRVLCE